MRLYFFAGIRRTRTAADGSIMKYKMNAGTMPVIINFAATAGGQHQYQ
jgi:hypothetical protein